jgi:hypothetical protein
MPRVVPSQVFRFISPTDIAESVSVMRKGHENTGRFARFTEFTSQIGFGTRVGYLWMLLGTPGVNDFTFERLDTLEVPNLPWGNPVPIHNHKCVDSSLY